MSSLNSQQAAFLKLVATPKDMAQVLDENPDLDHRILESEKCSAADRLRIYSTAYYLRILETMKQNYSTLLDKMGEAEFATLVGDYILAHPPSHYSLNYVDQFFVEFIEDPELSDIALFEKIELECFFSKDTESLSLSDLEAIPQEEWMGLELRLIPSCGLVEFQREEDKHLLFFRPELDVEYRSIDETQAELLEQLQASPRFDLLCEKAAEIAGPDEAVRLVGKYLMTWVNDGIFEKPSESA